MSEKVDAAEFDELVNDLEEFADNVGTAPLGQVMADLPEAMAKHQRAMAMLDQFKADIAAFEAATCTVDEPSNPA